MPTLNEQIAALKLPEMTEEDYARYLGLSPAQYEKMKPTLTDDDHTFHQQARAIEALCPLWQSGVEPYPSDVVVNGRAKRKKRRAHKSRKRRAQ